MQEFSDKELWRMLTLYGLNTATYKIALGQCLCNFTEADKTRVTMEMLAKEFFDLYNKRLENGMPQLSHETRLTVMEKVVAKYKGGVIGYDEAIDFVKNNAFGDVVPRFHNLDRVDIGHKFYEITDSGIILTDSVFKVFEGAEKENLKQELDARWSLLESAFAMKRENAQLINDIKKFYLLKGYERTDITYMKDMLNGYQEGRCFYCGEMLDEDCIHVDHVIPRAFLYHDEPWNLVLSHGNCSEQKSDFLPSRYYIKKLVDRNERLIKSNHPLSQGIKAALGDTPAKRQREMFRIYDEILNAVTEKNVWGGTQDFIPEKDPFYRSMIAMVMKQ